MPVSVVPLMLHGPLEIEKTMGSKVSPPVAEITIDSPFLKSLAEIVNGLCAELVKVKVAVTVAAL